MNKDSAANGHQTAPADETRKTRRRVRRLKPLAQNPAAQPEPNESADVLLRPSASCPSCGARPALRVTRRLAQAVAQLEPDDRVGSYQCQRRGCGAVYDLSASAYANAA
jgi:hypothetical protein